MQKPKQDQLEALALRVFEAIGEIKGEIKVIHRELAEVKKLAEAALLIQTEVKSLHDTPSADGPVDDDLSGLDVDPRARIAAAALFGLPDENTNDAIGA